MSILERFEQRVDRLVNGALDDANETDLKPVEIAAALHSEVDDNATSIGAGRTVAPNTFAVDLSATDFSRLMPFEAPLKNELISVVKEHIAAKKFITPSIVGLSFSLDNTLPSGVFRITSESVDESGNKIEDVPAAVVRKGAHVLINGYAHPLTLQRTIFGRGTEADVRIDDNGVSRKHFEIVLGTPPKLHDLNSTNGTYIYADRITEVDLVADVDIKVGNTVVQFRTR